MKNDFENDFLVMEDKNPVIEEREELREARITMRVTKDFKRMLTVRAKKKHLSITTYIEQLVYEDIEENMK